MNVRSEKLHIQGTCWVSDSEIYINIPKNASTTQKEIMKKKGAVERNYYHLPTKEKKQRKVWTIIREPMDRFISAMCQIKRNEECPDIFNNEHLKPQTWFLQGIKIDEYIKFDSLNGRKLNKSTRKQRDIIKLNYDLLREIYLNDIKLYNKL